MEAGWYLIYIGGGVFVGLLVVFEIMLHKLKKTNKAYDKVRKEVEKNGKFEQLNQRATKTTIIRGGEPTAEGNNWDIARQGQPKGHSNIQTVPFRPVNEGSEGTEQGK